MKNKYQSITTPDLKHDAANMLTELILINKDPMVSPYPWSHQHKVWWGKTVSAIKKLTKQFNITTDQLAFYVYRCRPVEIDGPEFAKMAVVAKKLFRKYDLQELVALYRATQQKNKGGSLDGIGYRKDRPKPKSLVDFLRELEDAEKKEGK
jgi:predicted enzyme involved in methoxymalonyl-ACP biosynthesis